MKKKKNKKKIKYNSLDYKNINNLKKFLLYNGKILSRKNTSLNAKKQKILKKSIKIARFLSLIHYCERHKK